MTEKAVDPTVPVYLRMPRSASASLNEIADALGLKSAAVANAIFRFITYPDWFVDWPAHVDMLRAFAHRDANSQTAWADSFSIEDWLRYRPIFTKLHQMGLIEDFDFSSSLNEKRKVICTFRISDAGRVIAQIFKETGVANAIEPDELKASGGEAPEMAANRA